jgi:hypothetical protein
LSEAIRRLVSSVAAGDPVAVPVVLCILASIGPVNAGHHGNSGPGEPVPPSR